MLTNLRIVSTIEDVLEGGWNLEDLNTAWNEFLKRLIGFLPQLLVAAVILLVGLLATKVVPKPIKSVLNRTRLDAVAVKYILRVVKISIWALVLMMVLDTVGVPVTSLLTLLAAIGAAVALAIKDNLANLASGVVLLFTKPFKAGDFIEVEGDSGVIREIEMMHTYLDTPGNMRVAIPNTKMMTATITNYSTYETRRQDLTFTISYEDNLLEAMAALHPLAEGIPCPVMDARVGQVYTALFRWENGKMHRLMDDCAIAADELREHLAEYGAEPKILVGDGAMLCYNKFEGQLENLSMAPDHLLHQRAGAMAELAASLLAEGKTVSAGELAPVYLRLPQAERELKLRQQKGE